MNLDEWRKEHKLSWQRLCIRLSEESQANGTGPIYYNRVWRLRTSDKARPTEGEIRALMAVTDNEVDSYKEPA